MCLVDITFFDECACILVSFSRFQAPMEDALNLPQPMLTPCGMPTVRSRVRLFCDMSGLFCPQRVFYSTFHLESHNRDCQRKTSAPIMTVGGLHMHFLWFKGFLAADVSVKASVETISQYRPLYSTYEPVDNYSNPDLYCLEVQDLNSAVLSVNSLSLRPLEILHPYQGKRSWVFPMYTLLASFSLSLPDVPCLADDFEDVHPDTDGMDRLDWSKRLRASKVKTTVIFEFR
ncbi:hypothetical protein BJ508DRAFT_316251, partial [Ascobolus immersus RN42]